MPEKEFEELACYKGKHLIHNGNSYYLSFINGSKRRVRVPITEEEAALIMIDRSETIRVLRKHRKNRQTATKGE